MKIKYIIALSISTICLLSIVILKNNTLFLSLFNQTNEFYTSGTIPNSLPFLFLVIALSTLISEDLTCITTGILISQSKLDPITGILGCSTGIFIGDMGLYLLGYIFGEGIFKLPFINKRFPKNTLDKQVKRFETKGLSLVFISRFLPGTRLITYVSAGFFRVPLIKFMFYFLLAVSLWTPILIIASAIIGTPLYLALSYFHDNIIIIISGTAGIIFLIYRLTRTAFSFKQRKLVYSSLRRWSRFEFWPRAIFYAPIALTIIPYCVIKRTPLLLTLANHNIECGGLIGESKYHILKYLKEFTTDKITIPVFLLLKKGLSHKNKLDQAQQFISEKKLNYPIILKPDIGERGKDVCLVNDKNELSSALKKYNAATLLQAYAPGLEFGIFYIKDPETNTGMVTSIVYKEPTFITGDGKNTLETLILTDSRAHLMAKFFLKEHATNLNVIIQKGDRIKLSKLGTHSKGALFINKNAHVTPELVNEIHKLCNNIDGLNYGRFDIKVPSLEDLEKGQSIQILEFNGLSGEPAHIYDPSMPLLTAYKDLFWHWKKACDIAHFYYKKGMSPLSINEFISYIKKGT